MINTNATHTSEHPVTGSLMRAWDKHKNTILLVIMLLMALYTTLSLGKQIWRLLWDTGLLGAVDLKYRYTEVISFFAGEKVNSPYPPASYSILWPLLAWIPEDLIRQVWGFFYILTFAWLFFLLAKVSKADNWMEVTFICMCLLSMNAAHATVGLGQLGLFIVALLITSVRTIHGNKSGILVRDIAGSLLFIAALVKPTVSVPFFWIVLFSGRLRPAIIIATGYIAIYIFSASFQDAGLVELTRSWLNQGSDLAENPYKGSVNISYYISHGIGSSYDLPKLNIVISLVLLMLLGMWIYHYRRIDVWILLGVTGIFSRLWTYHHTYDDVVILFTMITLFRIAKNGINPETARLVASTLLFSIIIINYFPAYVLKAWQPPWPFIYIFIHLAIWAGSLAFLMIMAHMQKKSLLADDTDYRPA